MEESVNMFGTRQIGRVLVAASAIREDPTGVRKLFADVLPIQVIYNKDTDMFDYWCIGDVFEVLEDSELVPAYRSVLYTDGRVEFHRTTFDRKVKETVKDDIMAILIEENVDMEDFKRYVRQYSKAEDEDFKVYDENFLGSLKLYLKWRERVNRE